DRGGDARLTGANRARRRLRGVRAPGRPAPCARPAGTPRPRTRGRRPAYGSAPTTWYRLRPSPLTTSSPASRRRPCRRWRQAPSRSRGSARSRMRLAQQCFTTTEVWMYIPAGYSERLRLSRSSSTGQSRLVRGRLEAHVAQPAYPQRLLAILRSLRVEQRLEAGTKLLTSVTSQTYQTWRARPRVRGRTEAVMVWTINASAAPITAALR